MEWEPGEGRLGEVGYVVKERHLFMDRGKLGTGEEAIPCECILDTWGLHVVLI